MAGALLASAPGASASAPMALSLEWAAPAGCPTQAAVLAEVKRLLRREPEIGADRLIARVAVARKAARWEMRLRTWSGTAVGERVLEGKSCAALSAAGALILAMTIDPTAVTTPAVATRVASTPLALAPAASTAPAGSVSAATPLAPVAVAPTSLAPAAVASLAPATVAPPAPATVAPPAPATVAPLAPVSVAPPLPATVAPLGVPPSDPSPETSLPAAKRASVGAARVVEPPEEEPVVVASVTRPRVRLVARASLAGDVGSLPELSGGPALAAGVTVGRLRVELHGTWWIPRRGMVEARPDAGGTFGMWTLGARACGVLPLRPVELSGCGSGEAGVLHARGFGVSDPGVGRMAWVALGAAAAASREVARGVALWIDLGVVVPLVRRPFVLDNVGEVHTPAAVVGRGTIGAEIRFF